METSRSDLEAFCAMVASRLPDNPPAYGLAFYLWMGRTLSDTEEAEMERLERKYGKPECNRALIRHVAGTGKYQTDDGETVSLAKGRN